MLHDGGLEGNNTIRVGLSRRDEADRPKIL